MSDVSNVAVVTIAPAHPVGVGKATPGGHIKAWRAQPAFAAEAKLNIIGANLWRPNSPAHRFYEQVLTKAPATVGECIEMAKGLAEPFTEKQIQGHLRWMFTANGAFLEVDGQRYSAPVAPVKAKVVKKAKVEEPVSAEQQFRVGGSKARKRNKAKAEAEVA